MFSELNIGRITEYFTENSINENIIGKRELKMHYNNRLKKFSDGKCLTANTTCLYTLSDIAQSYLGALISNSGICLII